jgi:hypothetical protein
MFFASPGKFNLCLTSDATSASIMGRMCKVQELQEEVQ